MSSMNTNTNVPLRKDAIRDIALARRSERGAFADDSRRLETLSYSLSRRDNRSVSLVRHVQRVGGMEEASQVRSAELISVHESIGDSRLLWRRFVADKLRLADEFEIERLPQSDDTRIEQHLPFALDTSYAIA